MFCPKCGNNLPDGSTLCETCGAVIPAAGGDPIGAPGETYAPPVAASNYPMGSLSDAWQLLSKDFGSFILAALIVVVSQIVISMIINMISAIPLAVMIASTARDSSPGALLSIVAGAARLAGAFIGKVVCVPFAIGFAYYILKKVRGQNPEFNDLFSGFTKFLVPSIITDIVVNILIFIGTILCILPGVVIALATAFWYFFIADGETQFMNALKGSYELVLSNTWMNLVFMLVLGLINVIVGVPTCGLGLLVSLPFTTIAAALVYDRMKRIGMTA